MGRFAKIEKVTPTERGTPFPLGTHRVVVQKTKYKDGDKEYFINEFLVKESTNPELNEGDKRSHVVWLNNPKAFNAPWSDVKAFICACLGLKGDEHAVITEEVIEFVILNNDDYPNGPLEGLEISVTVSTRKKKDDDGEFSPHIYHDVDPDASKQLLDAMIEMGIIATG